MEDHKRQNASDHLSKSSDGVKVAVCEGTLWESLFSSSDQQAGNSDLEALQCRP